MLALFVSLIVFSVLASSTSYEAVLNQLVEGTVSNVISEGEFVYSAPEIDEFTKRDGDPFSSLQEIVSTLPEINVYSYDNVLALDSLSDFATEALRAQNYGDFFYLWQVMYHNGYSNQINDWTSGELQYELQRWFGDSPRITEDLAQSSTNNKVAQLYQNVANASTTQAKVKRDYTECHEENVPNKNDCEKLMGSLTHGWMNSKNMSRCKGNCCASWSKVLNVHAIYIESKVGWCKHKCVDHDRSCKISRMDFDDKIFSFCVASTIGCTD